MTDNITAPPPARRPQTGQLHQYYAQAIAGLVLLALVLAVVR